MDDPRIIFAGTPEFAVESLRALVECGRVPVAVLTQPDRPAGRGKQLTASAVKQFAAAQAIPVLQPATLKDATEIAGLRALRPDLLVVAAYGLILPQSVLDIPVLGSINVHASLLPRWRGAAPIQAAILAGDAETGISLMAVTAGLDSGPVYARQAVPIAAGETAGELHDRLARAGGELLARHLDAILDGSLAAEEQDPAQVTYAAKIANADAELRWQQSAVQLERAVRAYNPVPGAWFLVDDERIKCWQASAVKAEPGAPGTVLAADRQGIVIACGDGALSLQTLQRPGRKPVSAAEFAAQLDLAGRRL